MRVRSNLFHCTICLVQVYLSLLKMYLKPTEVPALRLQNSILEGVEMKPDIDAAIEIMNANHHKIDVTQVSF